MGAYRKKPVVVQAEQFDRGRPAPAGVCFEDHLGSLGEPHVHTLEGLLNVSHLDWIVTGVKGEKYPCKPDIFEATYEAVTS